MNKFYALYKKPSGIFIKFIFSFLIVSIIPVLVLGVITLYSIQDTGVNITENVAVLIEKETKRNLELQAIKIAGNIERFLKRCEFDLIYLASLPRTEFTYQNFSLGRKSEIWFEENVDSTFIEKKDFIPLYKEVLYVDMNGDIRIFIKGDQIISTNTKLNVFDTLNTTYKCEKYFSYGVNLDAGDIYVSHLNGFYVSRQEQIASDSPSKLYDGVFRFATPVYDDNDKAGIVVIGVDHKHFMEFTQHVLPRSESEIVFPDYNSGDYAFLFDDEGWIITHPKIWDIKGVDSNGKLIEAYSAYTDQEMITKGFIPFNLDSAGFIHENYPVVAKNVRNKKTGTVITTNVGGVKKIMAFTPVNYNRGVYSKYGVFGGVTIGTEINKFNLSSANVKTEIKGTIDFFISNFLLIILSTSVVSFLIAFFLTRQISQPIIKLTKYAEDLAKGKFEKKIHLNRKDEIGVLAESFNSMSIELERGRNQLVYSNLELQNSQTNIENYASDLEYQLNILKSIQSISNIIGSTFEINTVLVTILRTCVESVNFDRAILYLIDEEGEFLEFKEMYGFTEQEEKYAKNSKYNINHADCIETKVVREGKLIFVKEFAEYEHATKRDKQIRSIAKSNSFVYVPLRVKERIIGILGADKLRTKSDISETDLDSLQILTNQAARVIENTRLYQEIVSQRNFVEDIISNMINGVISTNGKGFITSINRAAVDILEFSERNLIGKNIWQILDNSKDLMSNMKESLTRTGIYKGYNVEVTMSGIKKYLSINASRVYNNGIHTASIVIVEDVSEKKHLDEEIEKIDRLATLGRFAAGIAHEIRNPLTGLSLFLDDFHDHILGKNQKSSNLFSHALSEIERLEKLINEILDYAVPDKGNTQVVNVNTLVKESLIFAKIEAEKHRIEVIVEYNDLLPYIEVDPEKIKQALLNLINNSIQFMPDGGTIKISLDQKIIDGKVDIVLITVEDTGPGFNDTDLNKIFDPFYSKREGGTGLGLAITHSIIQEQSGTIIAKNNEPRGAKFIITLPRKI